MNWHQIAIQIVTNVLFVALAGIVVKYYFDAAIKRLEGLNARQLEIFRDELNQKRDSRQALISQSNYATQKSLELEFKAIQDIYEALGELDIAFSNWLPYNQIVPLNETTEQMRERMFHMAKPLGEARNKTLRLTIVTKLFYPQAVCAAVQSCLDPVTAELFNLRSRNENLGEAIERAQSNRDRFHPIAAHARKLLRERLDELKRLPD
jgi:hypothetical protein